MAGGREAHVTGTGLYSQRRVGMDGRVFHRAQLRSMSWTPSATPDRSGPEERRCARSRRWSASCGGDPARRAPQFWSTSPGTWFVGPRPERPEFVQQLTQQIPFYGQRHVIKPDDRLGAGAGTRTGPRSKRHPKNCSTTSSYIKHMSVALDRVHRLRDAQDRAAAPGL